MGYTDLRNLKGNLWMRCMQRRFSRRLENLYAQRFFGNKCEAYRNFRVKYEILLVHDDDDDVRNLEYV